MNPISLKTWSSRKEELRKKYPELTNEDLAYEIGKEHELLERLERRLKKNKEEIRSWLTLMG